MSPQDFTNLINVQVIAATSNAVLSLLKEPPGDAPLETDVALSRWFLKLTPVAQGMIQHIIAESAAQAAFNFMTMLDGVTKISPDGKAHFELYCISNGTKVLVNDPNVELHKLVSTPLSKVTLSRCLEPYEVGEFSELLSKSRVGDDLDIHHVPDKVDSIRNIQNYDPETAPAIALPKGEHKKLTEGQFSGK